MSVIWYIVIGIVSGFLAGKIMRGGGFGLWINLVVRIIGGLLGSLITSVVGAVLLLWILSLFRKHPRSEEL